MPYTLQTSRTDYKGGKNILASEHFQFIEAGATLDATAFGEGYIEVGTLVAKNSSTGKFEKFTTTEGYEDFGILNIDVECDGVNDIIVGEVIVRGSVYEQKLPETPSEEFKAKTPMIRYVREV
jgi:hypothetical protein